MKAVYGHYTIQTTNKKAKKERSRKLTVGETKNMTSHNNHSDEDSQGSYKMRSEFEKAD